MKKSKSAINDFIDELEDYDEENSSSPVCVQLDMLLVHPKSVQQCCVKYQPGLNQSAKVLTSESFVSSDGQKTPVQLEKPEIPANFIISPPQKTAQLNLLTPDSFSSPVDSNKKQENNNVSQEVMSAIFMLAKTTTVKPTSPLQAQIPQKPMENVLNLVKTEENLLKQSQVKIIPIDQPTPPIQPAASSLPNQNNSGGSSPSREVREILSQKGSATSDIVMGYCDDSDKDDLEVLNDLNINCDYKMNDEDFDDLNNDSDGNEEDNEDEEEDESDGKKRKENLNSSKTEWPKAPEVPLMNENQIKSGPDLSKLEDRMSKMIEIMEQQSRYIAELRHEIYNLKEKQNADTLIVKNIAVRSEENVKKVMEETYVRHERQNHQKFEQLLQMR
jgi:hypothetical protein